MNNTKVLKLARGVSVSYGAYQSSMFHVLLMKLTK